MPSIVRIGDGVSCGDVMAQGSGNVFANGMPVSRVGVDLTAGHCFTPTVTTAGSPNVLTNSIVTVVVSSPIQPHTCGNNTHGGTVAVGSPNVFLNEGGGDAPTGHAAIYAVLDGYNQPGVSRVDAGNQHDDDGESDPIYVSYRRAATQDAGGVAPVETVEERASDPVAAPGDIPTDCADIRSFVGTFPVSFLLSPNFTLAQLTTNTIVSNYPVRAQVGLSVKDIVCNLRALCVNVLEPLYAIHGTAVKINSGFRHGTGGSQHYKGEACDIAFTDTPTSPLSFARAKTIKDGVTYDQYIYEQNNSIWHHVSYKTTGNRRVVLTKPRGDEYLQGLYRITT